jgi:pimeloyl-ACP methyl ester carboxylesterase
MKLSSGGVTLNYQLVGQGPVVVLTRGLGGCLDSWAPPPSGCASATAC